MQYGQENKVIDHKLKLLLIVKQILPRKCLENSMENMHTDVGVWQTVLYILLSWFAVPVQNIL